MFVTFVLGDLSIVTFEKGLKAFFDKSSLTKGSKVLKYSDWYSYLVVVMATIETIFKNTTSVI